MLVRGLESKVMRSKDDGSDDSQGWKLCGMNDPVGRRGVWFRTEDHPENGDDRRYYVNRLEVCSGREGGDSYVDLKVGEVLTEKKLWELYDALDRGRWMCEDGWDTMGVQRAEWVAERAQWDGGSRFLLWCGEDGGRDVVWVGDGKMIPREWADRDGRFVVTVSFEPADVAASEV